MSELFRLAITAAAGYVAYRQAGQIKGQETAPDGTVVTSRLNPRGRFMVGLGVALAVYLVLPVLTGEKATLGSTARRLLRERNDDDADCGCGG